MKKSKRITALLYFLAAILFFISSIIGKNLVYIPIGCCFICLGIVYSRKKEGDSITEKNKDNMKDN